MATNANPFKKAEKAKAKLRLALMGVSGTGKTWSALSIAQSLGRIAVIDTEHGSASKYAHKFAFDTLELTDYNPQKYIDAIQAAGRAGCYDVLVIDSLSHAWNGAGGALEMVDRAAARSQGNKFAGWRDVTPLHNQLVEAILASPLHIIATMRSKSDYVLEKNESTGKTAPRKVGMAPIQREGMEYEFDLVGDLDLDHTLIVTKTRIPELDGQVIQKPGGALGDQLKAWLAEGVDAPPLVPKIPDEPAPARVSGAGIPQSKPAETPKQEQGIMRQRPDETETDPNLYIIEKLIINPSDTALQYVLAVHKSQTRILLADPGVLEHISVDGVSALALEPKTYRLFPMWSVQADHTAQGWDVQRIDAGVPEVTA